MIFDQNRNPKRSWSKIGRPDVNYGCPMKTSCYATARL